MDNQPFYLIQGELFGGMGTRQGGKVSIAYQQKEIAVEVLHTLEELQEIWREVIEELQPSEYPNTYKHLQKKIVTGHLKPIVKAMFKNQLELGQLRMVEYQFNKVTITK